MLVQDIVIAGEPCHVLTLEDNADAEMCKAFVRSQAVLAFDTEATGLDPYEPGWELRLLQVGDANISFNIPANFYATIDWVCSQRKLWIAHNAPHDCLAVDRFLNDEKGMLAWTIDTKIISHLIDSRSEFDGGVGHRLKENLAVTYVDRAANQWEVDLKEAFKQIEIPIPGEVYKSGKRKGEQKMRKALMKEGWRHIDLNDPRYLVYSGTDPILTMRVWRKLSAVLGEHELVDYEHELQMAVDEMARRGLPLDVGYTEQLSQRYAERIELGKKFLSERGVDNPNSNIQVANAIIVAGHELTEMTDSGKQYKVGAGVLNKITDGPAGEIASSVVDVKQVSKRKAAYADAMLRKRDGNNRVHASINTLAARTARMSVSDPPFQQLPSGDQAEKELARAYADWLISGAQGEFDDTPLGGAGEIRRCIAAPPGLRIISSDFDQIELRIIAELAGELEMIDAANAGVSLHEITAEGLFGSGYSKGQYKLAKIGNFCTVYGGGAKAISEQAGVPLKEAQTFTRQFREQFPAIHEYKKRITRGVLNEAFTPGQRWMYDQLNKEKWEAEGEERVKIENRIKRLCYGKAGTVKTPYGRTLYVDAERAYAGVNYMVQSTARDVLGHAILRLHKSVWRPTMLMVVHDEILGMAHADRAELAAREYGEIMTTQFGRVTLTASGSVCGKSWGEAYP